jgi:hypothetical protein
MLSALIRFSPLFSGRYPSEAAKMLQKARSGPKSMPDSGHNIPVCQQLRNQGTKRDEGQWHPRDCATAAFPQLIPAMRQKSKKAMPASKSAVIRKSPLGFRCPLKAKACNPNRFF